MKKSRGFSSSTRKLLHQGFFGFVLTMVLIFPEIVDGQSDSCDWTASGMDHPASERGVQPVYLRCQQGSVHWLYPRGALRVVLRRGMSGREFRGCVKVSPSFQGARLYLEGPKKLTLLYAPADGRHPQLPRCFKSRRGQVALYVEAEPVSLPTAVKPVAEFLYHLEPPSPAAELDPTEECRPCSDDELLQRYCTSDFVVWGKVQEIRNNFELQTSEIDIKAERLVRQTNAIFVPPTPLEKHRWRRKKFSKHLVSKADSNNSDDVMLGTVHMPLVCGAKQGAGEEFVFFGEMVLGAPKVRCAPRLRDWLKVRDEAIKTGTGQCDLGDGEVLNS